MSSIEPVVSLPGPSEKSSERRRAFNFGAVIAVASCCLGAFSLYRGASARGYAFAGFGAAVLLYSIAHPAGALVLRRGWLLLGGLLGRINSVLILSVAYIVLLTPLSLLFRVVSRRSFKLPRDASYFTPRQEQRDAKHFEHPY
jgi:hypothetical protein